MKKENKQIDAAFTIKTANQCIRESKQQPVPKMLFGEFWREGELSMLFGDSGSGKSVLAVQIAESIARGKPVEPQRLTARPQKVLYFDFELTDKQFEMRYAKFRGDTLKRHYRFSDRFCRIPIDPTEERPNAKGSFEQQFYDLAEYAVCRTSSKVMIIDGLTRLRRCNESTIEGVRFLRTVSSLKSKHGLSVLVLSDNPKMHSSEQISTHSLQSSKVFANFADNAFVIGRNSNDAAGRYLKHIKFKNLEKTQLETDVAAYRITKTARSFLAFEYQSPETEANLRRMREDAEWELIERVKRMSDEGDTIREIAQNLGISKSTAHRMLHQWQPDRKPIISDEISENNRAEDYSFREESYRGEFTDDYLESIGLGRVWQQNNSDIETPVAAAVENENPAETPPQKETAGLTAKTDGYGRLIFVESEDINGKPTVWFQHDEHDGIQYRYQRNGYAVIREQSDVQLPYLATSDF